MAVRTSPKREVFSANGEAVEDCERTRRPNYHKTGVVT